MASNNQLCGKMPQQPRRDLNHDGGLKKNRKGHHPHVISFFRSLIDKEYNYLLSFSGNKKSLRGPGRVRGHRVMTVKAEHERQCLDIV